MSARKPGAGTDTASVAHEPTRSRMPIATMTVLGIAALVTGLQFVHPELLQLFRTTVVRLQRRRLALCLTGAEQHSYNLDRLDRRFEMARVWQLQEAKSKLSELVDEALRN